MTKKSEQKYMDEAQILLGGLALAFYQEQVEKLSMHHAAALLGLSERDLRARWEECRLDNPLSPQCVRLEGRDFRLNVRLSDLVSARIVAGNTQCLAEAASGERWQVMDSWGLGLDALLPGDEVLLQKERGDQARLITMKPAKARALVCRVFDGPKFVRVDHPRFSGAVVELSGQGVAAAPGTLILVEVAPRTAGYPPKTNKGRLLKVLGSSEEARAQLAAALEKFALPHEFPESVRLEAEALPDVPDAGEVKERVDLRDIPLMTIDGEDARDFDDAVWACSLGESKGWRLLVAIADVSHYVTEGSALDSEAQKRATSVYFPSCVIPMLPEKLSNVLCSLNPGVDRCVMVCDLVISASGETMAYQFYPGLIHSHARLTYTAAWNAINGDPSDLLARGGSIEAIYVLYDLYRALRAARVRRGAIDFETQETQVVTGDNGLIKAIERRDHNDAHRLIEECMLAANVAAADFIERRKALSLFRVHEAPAPDRLRQLRATLSAMGLTLGGGDKPTAADFDRVINAVKGSAMSDVVQTACLRTMQRAMYTPVNVGHYGLGYKAYTHFTSPIRRYPDLLVHRTIRALLKRRKYVPTVAAEAGEVLGSAAGEKVVSVNEQRKQRLGEQHLSPQRAKQLAVWETLGLVASACERRADDASRDVTAWLKCRFMENQYGREFDGTVTGVIGAGLFVTLDDPFVDGFVHVSRLGGDYYEFDESSNALIGSASGKRFQLGTRLKVKLFEVDPDQRRIDFTLKADESRSRASRGAGRRGRFEADPWNWDWDEDPEDFDFEAFCGERPARKKKKRTKKTKR